MKDLLLALDAGNSNIVLGLFRGAELVDHWRVKTDRELTEDQHALQLAGLFALRGLAFEAVSGIAVASVVPPVTSAIRALGRRYFNLEPLFVGAGIKTGIILQVDDPRTVGSERIANALAAYERHRKAVIVVDFGTATNFDVVSDEGHFLGGAIAPGILVASEALFERAAALPRIELTAPPSAIGRNTVTNMQSGIVFGFAGQVDGIVRRIQGELGGPTPVIATGGLVEVLSAQCETVTEVDPLLTLTGLRLIYERNQS